MIFKSVACLITTKQTVLMVTTDIISTTHILTCTHTVFREGDKGDSWYVILRGSVNVLIQGKGVVCSLHEGQEFGKLAVVNEAVR